MYFGFCGVAAGQVYWLEVVIRWSTHGVGPLLGGIVPPTLVQNLTLIYPSDIKQQLGLKLNLN